MTRTYISIISIALIATIWNTTGIHSEAGTKEEALNKIYTEVVDNGADSVTVEYPSDDDLHYEDIKKYFESHKEGGIYSGNAIVNSRNFKGKKKGNTYTFYADEEYDIEKADELTDKMIEEIGISEDATDREKMAAICDYLTKTFDYDTESQDHRRDFVNAYYGNRRILCGGYANATYILANKMGIECDYIHGKDHVYNIVKFSDSKEWTAYDLTSDFRYAAVGPISKTTNIYNETDDLLNEGKTYKAAGVYNFLMSYIYYTFKAHKMAEIIITIAVIIYLTAIIVKIRYTVRINRKIKKRNKKA